MEEVKSKDTMVREMKVGSKLVFPLSSYDTLCNSIGRARRKLAPEKIEYKLFKNYDKATVTIKRIQ